MKRRNFILTLGGLSLAPVAFYGVSASNKAGGRAEIIDSDMEKPFPFALSEEEWKKKLTDAEFYVLRKEGTERPFTSPLNDEKRAGTYVCAGCGNPIFTSDTKYDSGTGWPSFYNVIDGAVGTKTDYKLFLPRTEYHCSNCGGHHGHVFKDGPKPTGLRYCNNGVALKFIPA